MDNFDDKVVTALKTDLASKFNVSNSRIVIRGFRAGSVIVDGSILAAPSGSTEPSASEVLQKMSTAVYGPEMRIPVAPVAAPAEQASSLGLTIGLAVVGTLAVVAIIAVVVIRSRKSHRRNTHHGNEMSTMSTHHHKDMRDANKTRGVC